ncbi:MAG: outer membrane beta-barrel protein [Bacteroidales bacterium]|nr:outer membrane beta-barrel protein [Bacteroidales bacterium]
MARTGSRHMGKILLFCVIFLLPDSARAQKLNLGVFGGLTASQVHGDFYKGFNKLGICAGLFMNRLIEYEIYWQAEIKYGTRGVYKGPSDNDLTLIRSTYHLVELPLSVHYFYDEKIKVETGFAPEILAGARFWDENGIIDPSIYPENRRFGLSVFAGIGYRLHDRIMTGLRYTNSAIPFRDPEEWNHPQYRGYYHNSISLSLAYSFAPQ